MKHIILAFVIVAMMAIPVCAVDVVDEQVSLFTMLANKQTNVNITEMNLNFSFYVDLNGDGKDETVFTNIYIGKSIESRIKIANLSIKYAGIAFAYPIEDLNNDGLKEVLLNKMFGLNGSSEVAIYSKNGLLWNYSKEQSMMIAIPDQKEILVSQIKLDFMHPSTRILKLNSTGNVTVSYLMSGLGYALPLDDVNSDGINDILVTKIVDMLPEGHSVSGSFIIDGNSGKVLSTFLETSEKEMVTTISSAVNDLDGDGIKDVVVQLIKQNASDGLEVTLKVISSKKAVETHSFNRALLWQKKLENFVSVTVVDDVDGDKLPDLGVVSYNATYPNPSVVYPAQVQNLGYEFDIYRGYDGKHLAHFEFVSK